MKDWKTEFEEKFCYKYDENSEDLLPPDKWVWTIRGSFPIEVETFIHSVLEKAYILGRKEEREKLKHKLGLLMDDNRAKELGNSLELLYGKRECIICGTNPEKQRGLILETINITHKGE